MIIQIPSAKTESVHFPAVRAKFEIDPQVLVHGDPTGGYKLSTPHGVSLYFAKSGDIEEFGQLLIAIAHTARYHELEFQLDGRDR